jgi:hypothetical protein
MHHSLTVYSLLEALGNLRVTCPSAQVVLLRARRVVATISLTLRYAS